MREEVSIRPNGSKRVQMHCDEPSRTRQEFKSECDLALTIKRFIKTSQGLKALEAAKGLAGGLYEDVSSIPDFQTAQNVIKHGEQVFEALPSAFRKRFNNDAAQYLDFIYDPKNLDELRQLGLAKPKVVEPPVEKTGA